MLRLTADQRLQRRAARLLKRADKALREGKISLVDYRDVSRVALRAMRPREHATGVGLGKK